MRGMQLLFARGKVPGDLGAAVFWNGGYLFCTCGWHRYCLTIFDLGILKELSTEAEEAANCPHDTFDSANQSLQKPLPL